MNGKNTVKASHFLYNPAIAQQSESLYFVPTEELVDLARPLAQALDILNTPSPSFSRFIEEHPISEALYYLIMQCRSVLPHYFPVHDICLLAANMLQPQLQHKRDLVLLDWEMLPVALLAAGSGARITLPPMPEGQEKDTTLLVTLLQQYLPIAEWIISERSLLSLPQGCLVLGQHPLHHGERDPGFLERLQSIAGGVFYTGWDFLGVKLHAHTRSLWIKSGLIRSVMQLPRPRRQGAMIYPAVVQLGTPATGHPIHLVRIPSCGTGPGAIEQDVAISLLQGIPSKQGDYLAVSPDDLARDGFFDLSPATHMAKQKTNELRSGLTLRQCAQVLRCQLPRRRVTQDDPIYLQASGEDPLGECSDGTFLCREVGVSELDSLTGFLNESGGSIVQVELTLLGKQGKYVIQAGDILFAFRGSAASIGQVGFVEEEGDPAITVQGLCIIRCLPDTDPVWLYHYLRHPTVREQLRARATGSSLLTINLESIRDIPVEVPTLTTIEEVNTEHRNIATNMATIARLRRDMRSSLRRIQHTVSLEDTMRNAQRSIPAGRPTTSKREKP